MEVWERTHVTAVCVTHDVDEAILLADRVVMMTNGPNARIGEILEVDLPRPRDRRALLDHPQFYEYRQKVLRFLDDYEHGAKAEAACQRGGVVGGGVWTSRAEEHTSELNALMRISYAVF